MKPAPAVRAGRQRDECPMPDVAIVPAAQSRFLGRKVSQGVESRFFADSVSDVYWPYGR